MLKFIGGTLVAVLAVVGFFLLFLLWTGVAIGSANAWILQGTFSDGWSAVWDRWLIAIGWTTLFTSIFGIFFFKD